MTMKANTKEVKESLKRISLFSVAILPAQILAIAYYVQTSIKLRVQNKGQGLNGPLKKYSEKYSQYRQKKGRQSAYRDLTFSGEMLNAMTVSSLGSAFGSTSGAKIFFGTPDAITKAMANEKRTPFFGLSDDENSIINTELGKIMQGLQL